MSEPFQVWLVDDAQPKRRAAIDALAEFPALPTCATFDLPKPDPFSLVEFYGTEAPADPDGHLLGLVQALGRRGFRPYWATGHAGSNGIASVHIHIPGLEHFDLVVNGPSAVVPGRRGIEAATSLALTSTSG